MNSPDPGRDLNSTSIQWISLQVKISFSLGSLTSGFDSSAAAIPSHFINPSANDSRRTEALAYSLLLTMDQSELGNGPTINGSHTSDAARKGPMNAASTDAINGVAPATQDHGEAKVAFEENFIGPEDDQYDEDADHEKITVGKETQVSIGGAGEAGVGSKKKKKKKPKSKRGLVGRLDIEYCVRTLTGVCVT